MEEEFLEQTRGREIDLVVCTDAEAILGIGDQGVGVRTRSLLAYRSADSKLTDISISGYRCTYIPMHPTRELTQTVSS